MIECSVIVPVHNHAALTVQCLEALFSRRPRVSFEIIVVDDGSTDGTGRRLERFDKDVIVLRRDANGGFATACNEGVGSASGRYLVFLNNDTIPQEGWLDALFDHAELHPHAGVVGAKLLFPNDTVQHAGVVMCGDRRPRHIYTGFPADHPAVSRSRPFQAVTAACALVRRTAFERAGGFDRSFRNCLEDADLCLRLGQVGHEVHYCHTSVAYHLESVSRGRQSKNIEKNAQLFHDRWADRIRVDEFDYYVEDGLIGVHYRDAYPIELDIDPLLALRRPLREGAVDEVLNARSRQVLDLLRETVRLTVHVAEAEFGREAVKGNVQRKISREAGDVQPVALLDPRLTERLEQIALDVFGLQESLERSIVGQLNGATNGTSRNGFSASPLLSYKKLVAEIRSMVPNLVSPGSTVLLMTRGDDDLLNLGGLQGWHFPRGEGGEYAGYYPADSEEAIEHLEDLRSEGADYLVIPSTSSWWLRHYQSFARHLEAHYAMVAITESLRMFHLDRNGGGGILKAEVL